MSELTEQIKFHLQREGYRELIYKDERLEICGMIRFVYTWAIVHNIDEGGYEGRWCYESWGQCIAAYNAWSGIGDPPGNWIKYKGRSGEYSNPNKIKLVKKK